MSADENARMCSRGIAQQYRCQRAHWKEHKGECVFNPMPFPGRAPPFPHAEAGVSQGTVPDDAAVLLQLPPDFSSPYAVEAFQAEQKQLRAIVSDQEAFPRT